MYKQLIIKNIFKEDKLREYVELLDTEYSLILQSFIAIFGDDIAGIINTFLIPSTVSYNEMIAAASKGDYRSFIIGALHGGITIIRCITASIQAQNLDMLSRILDFCDSYARPIVLENTHLEYFCIVAAGSNNVSFVDKVFTLISNKWGRETILIHKAYHKKYFKTLVRLYQKNPDIVHIHSDTVRNAISFPQRNSWIALALKIFINRDIEELIQQTATILQYYRKILPDRAYFIYVACWDTTSLDYLLKIFDIEPEYIQAYKILMQIKFNQVDPDIVVSRYSKRLIIDTFYCINFVSTTECTIAFLMRTYIKSRNIIIKYRLIDFVGCGFDVSQWVNKEHIEPSIHLLGFGYSWARHYFYKYM